MRSGVRIASAIIGSPYKPPLGFGPRDVAAARERDDVAMVGHALLAAGLRT